MSTGTTVNRPSLPALRRPGSPFRGGKREQTKARNRGLLLESARRVFSELGYGQASVRDIVRASGLAVGTFYEYFRDKDEAFAAVADDAFADLRRRLQAVRQDLRFPFEERLFAAFRAYFEFAAEASALAEVIEQGALRPLTDAVARARELSIQELREDFAADLQAVDVDPELIVSSIAGVCLMVGHRQRERERLDVDEAARFATEFTLGGLRGLLRNFPTDGQRRAG
jgi:AcrR family transcriptional regulator